MGVLVIADGDGLSVLAAINAALASLGTQQKGNTRPADAGAGTLWVDGNTPSTTLWSNLQYNGTSDMEMSRVDTTTGKFRLVNSIIDEMMPASVAASGTVDLGAQAGNSLDITGNTTITSFGTSQAGLRRTVRFTGTPQVTYNATSMILPGGVSLIAQAGDIAEFLSLGSGNWVCTRWSRASGGPVLGWHVLDAASMSGASYIKDSIPSWVNNLRMTIEALPVTDSVEARLILRKSSGTDITTYQNQNIYGQGSVSVSPAFTAGASSFVLAGVVKNTSTSGGVHAVINFSNIQSGSRYKKGVSVGTFYDGTYQYTTIYSTRCDDTAAITGVKFLFSSGNISDGRIILEGSA